MMDGTHVPGASGADFRARARVDGRIRSLVMRLEAGEIAVIDQLDLDRASAHALVSARPCAVLNAATSTSGRHQVLGPKILLDAGIPVIDDLGPDIMSVREGETLEIFGSRVVRDGVVIASGRTLTLGDLERDERELRRMISTQIGSFAATIDEYLALDGPVLEGVGLPNYSSQIASRPVLLVLDDARAEADMKQAKRWIADSAPYVIGVDAGANLAAKCGYMPDLVVGDMERIEEKPLRRAKHRVVRRGHDGLAPGRERCDRMGLSCTEVEMSGTGEDVAILVATHSGANSIVVAGGRHDLEDFIDRGRSAMSPSFFSRLAAGDVLVSARAVAATHRPRIAAGWLLVLLVAMLSCLGVALWSTPWGYDLFTSITTWVKSFAAATDSSSWSGLV